ncbi:MAG: flagellar biosynthesis protein [Eubacterium sp.]|nr:flagellar biosynthesis protein [Eubacterium sp.]
MQERLRNLLNRIIEWWKKFTTKQKTLIGSISAAVVVALFILAYVVTRPTMVTLAVAETTSEASEIVTLLEDNNIDYKTSADGLTISINSKDEAAAHLLLGSNGIPSEGYSIDSVFDGSFSTTEADKQKKYQLYLEQKMADELVETQVAVDDAKVSLSIPDNDGTILSAQEDTYVSIILTLNQDIEEENATAIAKFAATAVGDEDTENVLIMDANSNVLFSGADSSSTYGVSSSYQALQTKAEADIKSDVSDVLLGSTLFDNCEIGLNLKMNFDSEDVVDTHYYTEDGMSQGYMDEQTTYNSESTEGSSAVPGTDSNDSTTYVIDTDDTTYSTVEEVTTDYLLSQEVTSTSKAIGTTMPDESSISVVLTNYVVYDEETMEKNGSLEDTTFDEFVAANSEKVQTEVSDDYYKLVANATGIPESAITIIAYDVPFFQYKESSNILTDYLQLILAAIILLMLGFVIFRSTRAASEQVEVEPELSVEALLESTKEEENVDDIGYQEKSEVRIAIEKFVDENPEAVAALLRNWLDPDWE